MTRADLIDLFAAKSHMPGNILCALVLSAFLTLPSSAFSKESGWGIGWYAGRYYDTEPAGFTQGNATYLEHYLIAVTATKTLWRTDAIPLSLEIDGMLGQQFGRAAITEVSFAPVLRWGWFPWNSLLHTDFRAGPLGVSYTTAISPLERGPSGDGSRLLNFLMLELDFSLPEMRSKEVFMRLHHRCSMYDRINTYGANGEDFLVFGYRRYF